MERWLTRHLFGPVTLASPRDEQIQSLLHRYGGALKLYARQWCNAPEDAIQDALYEWVKQKANPDNLVAWLFTAVRFRALNMSRSDRRRESNHRDATNYRPLWFEANAHSAWDSEELQHALQQLESIDREIVIARIWGELTFEQIAELTHTPLTSVHRLYKNALLHMRRTLDGPKELKNHEYRSS